MKSSDQKAWDELASWQSSASERTYQIIDITVAGTVVLLIESAGSKLACGSGSDLTNAANAALTDWNTKYPVAGPKK